MSAISKSAKQSAKQSVSATKGCLIAVVGPSGSGKDSLLAAVREHYADNQDVKVVQRVITRPSDAGHEPHKYLSGEDFIAARDRGEFSICWEAHNLHYGVPTEVHDWIENGKVAILNGSRGAMRSIRQVFPTSRTVLVSVDEQTLASRLAKRARESSSDISARLGRRPDMHLRDDLDIEIDNSGDLQLAVNRLLGFIESVR